jgi:isopropylmalate/homocitrate/citramalate synthase
LVMFATHPSLTGKQGEVVLGKKSGKASIIYKMGEMGLGELDDETIGAILTEVKSAGIAKRDVLTNDEFANIVTAMTSK